MKMVKLLIIIFNKKNLVCLLGSGTCRLIFNIKNKNKIILVGALLAPLKEPNAGIGEVFSPITSASHIAFYSSSLLLFTAPNFLYIISKNSLISFNKKNLQGVGFEPTNIRS